ncbi:other/FunK1 protein kinase [Coprinopsis cinerea AmutBmut pab1-1]|nr:other/FunK1 protein kinase [Coprinopsis cinerea AmutBmut pab1-1]
MKCSTENHCSRHLTYALNNILKYGRGKVIGTFKHVPGDDESIMVVNDPDILECESKSLSECTDYYKPKRKPDLIHMTIQALGRIVGRRDEPFDVWFAQLAKSHGTSPNGLEGKKAHWRDPLDCWETRMSDDKLARLTNKEYQFTANCADERPFDRASVPATKPTARQSAPPSSPSRESARSQTSIKSSGGVKRPWTEEQSGIAPKKPKTEREPEPLPLRPETQAGFYGLELMRARWNRTHAIVILISLSITAAPN